MILVSQDVTGLRSAMAELLERDLMQPPPEDLVREEDQEKIEPFLHSPGYYARLEYLLELEEMVAAGVKVDLYADEVAGLAAIRRARAEFSKEHPRCEACGEPQWSRFVQRCHSCTAVFRKGA